MSAFAFLNNSGINPEKEIYRRKRAAAIDPTKETLLDTLKENEDVPEIPDEISE